MGVELELGVLFGLLLVGGSLFAPFDAETPAWKRVLKWTVVAALTLGVYPSAGHLAVLVPLGFTSFGLAAHVAWCRRHAIDPIRATPRRRYYRLRGWAWPDDEH